jgi:hypothetical protein
MVESRDEEEIEATQVIWDCRGATTINLNVAQRQSFPKDLVRFSVWTSTRQ